MVFPSLRKAMSSQPAKSRRNHAQRTRCRRLRVETLECRRVLAAALYVDNAADFVITADAAPPGLSAGDMVTWNAGGADHQQGEVQNLEFGTDAFASIQGAISSPYAEDAIYVAAGTYSERLSINKDELKIIGQDTASTIIDYTGQTAGQAGVYITGNNVQLRNVAVTHSSPNSSSVPRYGIKADYATGSAITPVDGIVIDNVHVSNSFRTGLDLNGVTDVTVNDFVALNNGGAGIFMTDVKGAALSNITTSGNPWAGVSVASLGRFFPLGTSGIIFSGTNSFGESATPNGAGQLNGGLQLEMGNFFAPAAPEAISWSADAADNADVTIQSDDFGYMVSGHSFDNANQYRRFYQSLSQAQAAALGSPDHINAGSRYIQQADDSNDFGPGVTEFLVYASASAPNTMSIQGAIDAAVSGDVINIAVGTYNENVSVNKGVTLAGAGSGPADTVITAAGSVLTVAADDVTVGNLRVTGGASGVHVAGAANTTLDAVAAVDNSSYGVVASGTAADLQILNSTLSGNNVGFRMGTADSLAGLTIADSIIADNTLHGIAVFASTAASDYLTGVEIRDSTFAGNSQKGMYFEKLSDALIDGVHVVDNGVDAAYGFNNGIDINLKYGAYSNIVIQCSVFSGSGVHGVDVNGMDFAAALAIKARGDAPSYNSVPATLDNVQVLGNVFQNSAQHDMTTAIRIGEPGKSNAAPTNVVMRGNDLSDGTFTGVDNTSAAAVDAAFNWWGTADAATIDSALAVGNVDFTPWLLDSAFSGNNLIFTAAGGVSLVVNEATGEYALFDNSGLTHSGGGAKVQNGVLKIHDQSSSGKIDVTGSVDGSVHVSLKGKGKPTSFTLDAFALPC